MKHLVTPVDFCCKSNEALFEEIHSQWIQRGDSNIEADIDFVAMYCKGILNVSLNQTDLLLGDTCWFLNQPYTPPPGRCDRLPNVKSTGISNTVHLEFRSISWQQVELRDYIELRTLDPPHP